MKTKNPDIHRRTASRLFGVDEDKVTEDQRRAAKTINYGIIYGMRPAKVLRYLATCLKPKP